MKRIAPPLLVLVSMAAASAALAQTLPTSQPNYLQIYREEVKFGHSADHAKVEAGWPAAYERTKNPYTYIALTSLTGTGEAWFVIPFQSHEAMAEAMKLDDQPSLAAALAPLRKADAAHVSSSQSILAMARKDLSHGSFPTVATQRFYEITIFRVKPGGGRAFEAAATAYGAAAGRGAPESSYRVYEVIAGMPQPTYLVFSSVTAYGAFDKAMANEEAIIKAATEEERGTLQKFSAESLVNSETIRFRLDPDMSYVPPEVRAQYPDFWSPKTPALARATPKPGTAGTTGTKPAVKPASKQEGKR